MTRSPERRRGGPQDRGGCSRQPEAVAWLQRELSAEQAAEYGRHVRRCPDCAAFAEDARTLLAALREDPVTLPEAPPADLAARVLRRCDGELGLRRRVAQRRSRVALLGAAAVLLFTVSLHVALQPQPEPAPAPAAGPAHWLAQSLQPDGRFDGQTLGGPRADELALHAFGLLALASASDAHEAREPALRAARWLLDQQADDGSIGAPAGVGFDHALATVALLEAGALTYDAAVREGADRAVAHIVARQARDGGWQPRLSGQPGSAPAQTAWTLAALLRARELGSARLDASIARGQGRLAADLGPGRAPRAAELDLAAVREVALGGSRPQMVASADATAGPALGQLYAASLAVLAAPSLAH